MSMLPLPVVAQEVKVHVSSLLFSGSSHGHMSRNVFSRRENVFCSMNLFRSFETAVSYQKWR